MVDKSIAVLPFVDMSEKKDQEYFGDGMAEEIIDLLVQSPGLKVIGRTSSFQFKANPRTCAASPSYSVSPMCWKEACESRVTASG
jgi:TolB-like protein